MSIKFISENRRPKQGEMIIYSGQYTHGGGIALVAWDYKKPCDTITENIPEISLKPNEVVLHHNLISTAGLDDTDFLNCFLEYMTESSREITFGPYCTKTLVVTLKDDWQSRCIPMEAWA